MAETTPNIGLRKPLESDNADIAVINQNMDRIDQSIEEMTGNFTAHKADYAANAIKKDGSVAMAANLDINGNDLRKTKSIDIGERFWTTAVYRNFSDISVAQEVILSFPAGFGGILEVTVASLWGVQGDSTGSITKRFNLSISSTTINTQQSFYTNLSNYAKTNFMITDAYFESGAWKVKIIKRTNVSSTAAIMVSCLTPGLIATIRDRITIGEVVTSTETFVTPEDYYARSPSIFTITSGFASGFTGSLRYYKTQENILFVSVTDITRDVDFTDGETINLYTLPEGYRPYATATTIDIALNSGGNPVLGAFFQVVVGGGGVIQLRAIANGKAGLRRVFGSMVSTRTI